MRAALKRPPADSAVILSKSFCHSEEDTLAIIVRSSEQLGAVEEEGYGAVVDAGDVHVLAK